jgi:hypothetical protein
LALIRILFFLSFGIAGVTVFGQQQKQLLKQEKDSITFTIGGGIDLYYGHHSSNKTDIPYYVSHAKHNQINLNLAYLNINLTYQKFRANVVPAIGTYMLANYAAEHQTAQRLVLANVGYQLNKEKNIWVDAGILNAPYTLENPFSKDQLMYTRSLASEYSPYFITGARLTAPLNNKTTFYGYLINGWQQVRDVNKSLSVGTTLEHKADSLNTFVWTFYAGDEKSTLNPNFNMRYYTDVQWIGNFKKWNFGAVASIGLQQKSDSINKNHIWWQATCISKYNFTAKHSIAARVEYFNDKHKSLVNPLFNMAGFDALGSSLCYSFKLKRNAMFRVEGKHLYSTDKIQADKNNKATNESWLAIGNITIWF